MSATKQLISTHLTKKYHILLAIKIPVANALNTNLTVNSVSLSLKRTKKLITKKNHPITKQTVVGFILLFIIIVLIYLLYFAR